MKVFINPGHMPGVDSGTNLLRCVDVYVVVVG